MPERRYLNSRPGEECIHIEILAAEIPNLLEDLYESSLGRNPETDRLRVILENAQERFAPPANGLESPCTGFHWIGQPYYSCDNCGIPAWEHAGMHVYGGGPFDTDPGHTEPWKPGEAEAMRSRFEAERAAWRDQRAASARVSAAGQDGGEG